MTKASNGTVTYSFTVGEMNALTDEKIVEPETTQKFAVNSAGEIVTKIGSKAGKSYKADGYWGDDIRKFDFLNYSYNPTLCTQEFGSYGIGKVVRVVNGEFSNAEVSYGVGPITYGDLTNDNNLEAIVQNSCWLQGANYGLSEIFVYTMKNGQASLLAQLNDDDFKRDYVRYFPGGTLWFSASGGVTVVGGNLTISVPTEGAHCCPEYTTTLKYRWNGRELNNIAVRRTPWVQ